MLFQILILIHIINNYRKMNKYTSLNNYFKMKLKIYHNL